MPPSGTLHRPSPTPGVNQAGASPPPTVPRVVPTRLCKSSRGWTTDVSCSTCQAAGCATAATVGWHWHHTGRLARLSLSIGSFPVCQFCPNNLVCHDPDWLRGRPSPLARPPRQGPLHNIAPKGKWVGPRFSQPVVCASGAYLATPAPLCYHHGQMGFAQLALHNA